MSFTFTKCFTKDDFEFCGLYEIQPKIFGDTRGYFFESYSERDFFEAGLTMKFVQDNQSKSSKGVLRGLHFQTIHPQGKLVRAIVGRVYDVAVDLRKGSETFGRYYGVVLDAEKQNQFYIPEGFAHGFLALTDDCIQSYKCTDFYHPEDECGLMWNDPKIGIDWESAVRSVHFDKLSNRQETGSVSEVEPSCCETDPSTSPFDDAQGPLRDPEGLCFMLSEKDKKHPAFSFDKKYFDINGNWIGE